MIYDDDILILVDPLTGRKGKQLQIKEIFGLGVSYTFKCFLSDIKKLSISTSYIFQNK